MSKFSKPAFKYQPSRVKMTIITALMCAISSGAAASYSCNGVVSYLGVDETGNMTIALSGVTAKHAICSVSTQGQFTMTTSACKAVYATVLTAKLTGKSVKLYYGDNGYACGSIPEWSTMKEAYFIEGPN